MLSSHAVTVFKRAHVTCLILCSLNFLFALALSFCDLVTSTISKYNNSERPFSEDIVTVFNPSLDLVSSYVF